jgi:hypothetical protein
VTVSGTADPLSTVAIVMYDPHYGSRTGAFAHADASGAWSVTFSLLYNTDLQAVTKGGGPSRLYLVTEHASFGITGLSYRGHDKHGYHYRLYTRSSSQVPGQLVELIRSGHVIGSGHMAGPGTVFIDFAVPTRSANYTLYLRWSGNASNGVQYVLPGASGAFAG